MLLLNPYDRRISPEEQSVPGRNPFIQSIKAGCPGYFTTLLFLGFAQAIRTSQASLRPAP
jgi:hypothetical protein